ncbi:MAG TPA: hypothetical protein DD803_05535 [Alcaligenes faecalis]|nr:hypothetical protein [Alcaligenes faecalis]HBQ88907.1 hypothetical protein [Alcaligenes faecalis]
MLHTAAAALVTARLVLKGVQGVPLRHRTTFFHLISGETVSLTAVRKTTLKQMGGTVPVTLNPDPNMDSLIAAFLVKAASGEFTGQSKGKNINCLVWAHKGKDYDGRTNVSVT